MHTAFQYSQYHLKRQTIALTGKVRIYNPNGQLSLFSEQKMFKLKEDIRVYSDESKNQELLHIKARQFIDFAAAYDVIAPMEGLKVGVLRRKGFRSMMRDQWELLNSQDQPIGVLEEDSLQLALIRRLLFNLIPQNYDIVTNNQQVADIRQRFNIFRYELDIDFNMDSAGLLDRRLGLAAAILLAIIEGRQD